jgi:hypothetical protein
MALKARAWRITAGPTVRDHHRTHDPTFAGVCGPAFGGGSALLRIAGSGVVGVMIEWFLDGRDAHSTAHAAEFVAAAADARDAHGGLWSACR